MGVSSWMYSQMVYGVHLELIKNHLKLPASDYSNCIDYEELIARSNVPVPTLAILSGLPLLAKWCDTKEEFMEMKDDEDVQIQQLYATLYPLLYAPYEIVAKIESESKSKNVKRPNQQQDPLPLLQHPLHQHHRHVVELETKRGQLVVYLILKKLRRLMTK